MLTLPELEQLTTNQIDDLYNDTMLEMYNTKQIDQPTADDLNNYWHLQQDLAVIEVYRSKFRSL